ncbi:MAG: ABC transporter permease [Candidatus Gastranaerophilales bacterium]|nr:ABC transporter permease [Candidatus Gastranaerophilales bacterium]
MQGRIVRILALIKKEFLSIFKDPKSRALIITPPILQLFVFANAITLEVKNIDISILDYSKSYQSRELVSRFSNSSWFRKIYQIDNLEQLKNDIDFKKSQAGIIIQNDFESNILKQKPSEILIIADGRQTNSASLVSGYISTIISNYSSELEEKYNIKGSKINVITRNWYNPNLEYKWFLTVSLIVMLAMVLCLLLSSLSIARERELGSFNQLLVSPLTSDEILFSKTIPPLIVAFISSIVITLIIALIFKVPFSGNIFIYLIATLISLVSIVALGLFISSFSFSQQQAILGVFAFQTPAVLLSGFVSPIEDMPMFFQYVSMLNPIRYYMFLIKGIYFKGMSAEVVFLNLIPLILITIIMILLARFSFKLKIE